MGSPQLAYQTLSRLLHHHNDLVYADGQRIALSAVGRRAGTNCASMLAGTNPDFQGKLLLCPLGGTDVPRELDNHLRFDRELPGRRASRRVRASSTLRCA